MLQLCHIYYTFKKDIANEDHGALVLGMKIRKKLMFLDILFLPNLW